MLFHIANDTIHGAASNQSINCLVTPGSEPFLFSTVCSDQDVSIWRAVGGSISAKICF